MPIDTMKRKDDKDDKYESDEDGEEAGTADSEKSSGDESTSSAETDVDEDSSDMDEEECDQRRTECLYDMVDLERQFIELREQLCRERTQEVEDKLGEVKAGRAAEYLQPLSQLQQNMQIRTQVAGILKELKVEAVRKEYDCELQSATQSFKSDKMLLYDQVKSELEEKIRMLEEDRDSIDITSDIWNELHFGSKKKKKNYSDPMCPEKRRKPITVTGPYVVYMLSDGDILDDWTTVKKAMGAQKRKGEFSIHR